MKTQVFTVLPLIIALVLFVPVGEMPTVAQGSITTTRISVDALGNEGNSWSAKPVISADGRYVVFESWADNLVAGDTNNANDIFFYDRQTGTPRRGERESP
jgi:hypothetical protein